MTNSNDLFDEPEAPRPSEASRESVPSEPAAGGEPPGSPPSGEAPADNVSRRQFLRGLGAAAVAGGVVGAGAAIGLGVTDDDAEGPVTERDAMSLGAPGGRTVSESVVRLNVNGQDHWIGVESHETLAEVLRRKLGLTGTKIGCDRSECSACTVMVNGTAMNSCSLLAIREDGREIVTIEGLSKDGQLSPVQDAFLNEMGLQCGFCTPGQIMQATALLSNTPKPTEAEIRRAMSGNLCKCSAYPNILTAIQQASLKGSV
jgi:aerobic-type carbon monoxide dehydrogenase small subunit (CoxS/CutS family)